MATTEVTGTTRKTRPGQSGDAASWRSVSRNQLADLLGVHPETVTAYVRQGMPVQRPGRRGSDAAVYDAVACLAWWRQHQGKVSAKEVAQTRSYEATAKLNEQRLAVAAGALLPREQVVLEGQQYTKAWASSVRALPRRARQSGIVHTAEDESALADLCRQVLSDISSWKTPADAKRADGEAEA